MPPSWIFSYKSWNKFSASLQFSANLLRWEYLHSLWHIIKHLLLQQHLAKKKTILVESKLETDLQKHEINLLVYVRIEFQAFWRICWFLNFVFSICVVMTICAVHTARSLGNVNLQDELEDRSLPLVTDEQLRQTKMKAWLIQENIEKQLGINLVRKYRTTCRGLFAYYMLSKQG